MNTTPDMIEVYLHQIIDELHPLFKSISDEELIVQAADHGTYTRDFKHKNGKNFRMTWTVYYGTPETVRTVFHPALELKGATK